MPTAAEFRQLASDLRNSAGDVEQAWFDLERERDYLRLESPSLRLTIDAAYTESIGQLKTLKTNVETVAIEFDRRADVCDDYAAEMRLYDRRWAMYHRREIDVRPRHPTRPAAWVDV